MTCLINTAYIHVDDVKLNNHANTHMFTLMIIQSANDNILIFIFIKWLYSMLIYG